MLAGVGGFPPLSGQQPQPVFPEQRLRELREELPFEAPERAASSPDTPSDSKWLDWEWPDWTPEVLQLSPLTSLGLLFLLLLLLGLLIYRMLDDVSMRRKRLRVLDEPLNIEEISEESLVAEGVSEQLFERAERAGQYALAVRLRYIQTLRELQDAGLIRYRKDLSNRDYQAQLKGQPLLEDFRTVTREYERYWFGKYPIDRLGYRYASQLFLNLHTRIQAQHTTENIRKDVH